MTVGAVNLAAFGLIIAMTLVTTPLGVTLAHKMEAAKLKRFSQYFWSSLRPMCCARLWDINAMFGVTGWRRVAHDPRLAQWAKRARQIAIGVA